MVIVANTIKKTGLAMKIKLNGAGYTIPDDSEYVAVDVDGGCSVFTLKLSCSATGFWRCDTARDYLTLLSPADFTTKCCAKVFDGAVIDFEVMT